MELREKIAGDIQLLVGLLLLGTPEIKLGTGRLARLLIPNGS
jgi:hypothetical protein